MNKAQLRKFLDFFLRLQSNPFNRCMFVDMTISNSFKQNLILLVMCVDCEKKNVNYSSHENCSPQRTDQMRIVLHNGLNLSVQILFCCYLCHKCIIRIVATYNQIENGENCKNIRAQCLNNSTKPSNIQSIFYLIESTWQQISMDNSIFSWMFFLCVSNLCQFIECCLQNVIRSLLNTNVS